ncbi:hypothetical protein C8T65DRAFT_735023 [Cerioporus squamosus]|nr:hypothetical protein C8T65DRAFT_735023 [Cerioporus squamosus]
MQAKQRELVPQQNRLPTRLPELQFATDYSGTYLNPNVAIDGYRSPVSAARHRRSSARIAAGRDKVSCMTDLVPAHPWRRTRRVPGTSRDVEAISVRQDKEASEYARPPAGQWRDEFRPVHNLEVAVCSCKASDAAPPDEHARGVAVSSSPAFKIGAREAETCFKLCTSTGSSAFAQLTGGLQPRAPGRTLMRSRWKTAPDLINSPRTDSVTDSEAMSRLPDDSSVESGRSVAESPRQSDAKVCKIRLQVEEAYRDAGDVSPSALARADWTSFWDRVAVRALRLGPARFFGVDAAASGYKESKVARFQPAVETCAWPENCDIASYFRQSQGTLAEYTPDASGTKGDAAGRKTRPRRLCTLLIRTRRTQNAPDAQWKDAISDEVEQDDGVSG